jgi:metallopeptidase MepB
MLEYWCWTPEVLKKLSKHYSTVSEADYDYWKSSAGGNAVQPEEILPGDMIASLVAARDVNAAHFYLNQLRISMFDLAVHSPESHEALERMDISAIHHEIRSDVFPPRGPESLGFGFNWAHGQVLNAHLMKEDYSAGYYSYML